jgi:Flp pilus assembly protein TadD
MPGNATALNNLGVAHENLGHLRRGEPFYRRAIALRPSWPDPQKNLRPAAAKTRGS